MIAFLVIRLDKSFDEVARMTIRQARLLQRNYAANDGHRETARLIVDSLVDLAVLTGYVKRKDPVADRLPDSATAAIVVPDTIIPELQAALDAQRQAAGWQPPSPALPVPESLTPE